MKLCLIAERIGSDLIGDGSIEITGVAGIREAQNGDITFFANPKYEPFLRSTDASAVIMSRNGDETGTDKAVLVADNPYEAFLKAIELFAPGDFEKYEGVHPTATIGEDVQLGDEVTVGPSAVIESGAVIGARTRILPGSYIGFRVKIGADCLIYPNVSVREDTEIGDGCIIHCGAVIGSDGFGFTKKGFMHIKIPQIGRVVIQDDVEVGANTTIDRATVGTTLIKKGTKIDNQVQVAHNVVIGENSILVAQVGLSGSTEVGNNVTLAGQAGIAGHIIIGDNVRVGAQAGVTKSIPPGVSVSGYPAREHSLARRIYAGINRIPQMLKTLAALEKRVRKMEDRLESDKQPPKND